MSAIPVVKEDFVEPIAHRFRLRDDDRVRAFLREHPDLAPLVLEVIEAAQRYMGAGTAITLEVVSDPESEHIEELYAFVETRLAPNEALAQLHAFDEAWWLEQAPRAGGKLTVSVEYV